MIRFFAQIGTLRRQNDDQEEQQQTDKSFRGRQEEGEEKMCGAMKNEKGRRVS